MGLTVVRGGNSFRPDMEPVEYDLPTQSTCTSCTFSEVSAFEYSLHNILNEVRR